MDFNAVDLDVALAFGADLTADPGTWSWVSMVDAASDPGDLRRLLNDAVRITRGRADETSQAQPAGVAVTLDNIDGALTPYHPGSPWWPNVRRGTPLRVTVAAGRTGLVDIYATTPDHASLDIVGDLDLRWDGVADWGAGPAADLIVKNAGAGQLSYWLRLLADGTLRLVWTANGTTQLTRVSTVPVTRAGTFRWAARATLEVDDGDGSHVVRFYTAPTIAGPWRPLGDPVTTAGTTSVWSGTGSVGVGSFDTTTYAGEVRDGLDGTIVAACRPNAEAAGTTSWVDEAGRTWTVASSDEVSAIRSVRFIGAVAAIAPDWPAGDNSHGDDPAESVVTVEAAGPLRRLGRNDTPTASLLRRSIPLLDPVAYWPLEDPSTSTRATSALVTGYPATVSGGNFAANELAPGSDPVVQANSAAFGIVGRVGPAAGGQWTASFLYLPDGDTNEIVTLWLTTNGTARTIAVTINAPSNLVGVDAFNAAGSLIDSSAFGVGSDVFTDPTWLHFAVAQDGSAIDVAWIIENVGGSLGGGSDTFAGCTCGRITNAWLSAVNADGWAFGHLFTTTGVIADVIGLPAGGFAGEDGTARLHRLALEAGVDIAITPPAIAEAMGAQPTGQLVSLLTEVADADLGILGEQVDRIGLAYRPRASLYSQAPRFTLSAAAGEGLVVPFAPVDDDQRLVNEVALSQTDGPTFVAIGDQAEGIYDVGATVNVAHAHQLEDGAYWRLHLGGFEGNRYPLITIDLSQAPAAILDAYLDTVGGDLIRITDLPASHPPGNLDLIVEGITETFTDVGWVAELACSPGRPWTVGVFADPILGRVDSDSSTLGAGIDADDTALTVDIADGLIWSHADGDFDICIDGERMTVTAIAGGASPQTFTVVRGVDGFTKAHDAGAEVRLADPLVLAW